VRTGLMFEPRGHDMMSGSILYPPSRADCDIAVLYIETSGCLPMCGHGTIGTVTFALEQGLVTPRKPGVLRLETPAGRVDAYYKQDGSHVESVRIVNVPSYLAAEDVRVDCPELGPLTIDIAYGGNFYAIVEPQENYPDLSALSPGDILRLSPQLRRILNETVELSHPDDPTIRGVSHIQWSGKPTQEGADLRNAVFYGDKAIDRSPCGTGTSARMAHLAAKGRLKVGDSFVHESIIGSLFTGRVEAAAEVGGKPAIVPSIEGWARITGYNTLFIDERDPYAEGFQVV
jgi:4-hydroxyproline epimerase